MFQRTRDRRRQQTQVYQTECLEQRRVLSGTGMELIVDVPVQQVDSLLPAVQKVREAAVQKVRGDMMQKVRDPGANDPAFSPNGIIAILIG